jgi:hypothetical protein
MPAKPERLPRQEPALPRLAGRQEVPEVKTIMSTVSNIGNRPNIFALRELEFLDNMLGLKGKERFTERALDAWAAKELGIDKSGVVPKQNLRQTGFATGSKVTGALSGAALGGWFDRVLGGSGLLGGAAGAQAGHAVGSYITSPSAALAAYKAMTRLEDVLVSKKAASILKAAARTGDTGTLLKLAAQLEREMVAAREIPFRQVAEQDRTETAPRYGGEPVKPLRR